MSLSMAEQLAALTGRKVPEAPKPQPKPKQHHVGTSKLSSLHTLTTLYMIGQAFEQATLKPVRLEPAAASKAAENIRVPFAIFQKAAREVGVKVVASTQMTVDQIILTCHHLGIEVRQVAQ